MLQNTKILLCLQTDFLCALQTKKYIYEIGTEVYFLLMMFNKYARFFVIHVYQKMFMCMNINV